MAKAIFKCDKCGKMTDVIFKPGEKVEPPTCECGGTMKRQFGAVNVGYIEEDDILKTGMMMTYQSKNNENR